MNENISGFTKIFKALADENRLRILLSIHEKGFVCEDSCRQNEICCKDLANSLSITTPTISHHIKELVNAGLIVTRKDGKWLFCRINKEVFEKTSAFLDKFLKDEVAKKIGEEI